VNRLIDIVQAAKEGDQTAFRALVRRFQDMAYGRAYAWLGDHGQAEDAAQEAFIDAYLHLDRLREPAAFPGWFGKMVVKHADRQCRSAKSSISLEDAPTLVASGLDPLEAVLSRETERLIQEQMTRLSQEHREAIELFHMDGYTQREIADFLDLPVTTVKKRLFDARKKLRKRIQTMAPAPVQKKRPSQNDDFERRVQFFIAIRTGDLATVEKLIAEETGLLTATTEREVAPEMFWPREITPIFWAAQMGEVELMRCLINCGADVNAQTDRKETPLHCAVMMGDHLIVDLLLAHGADPNLPAQHHQTALHRAVMRGDVQLVEALIANGADIEMKDAEKRTAADWAVLKTFPEVLDLLVKSGARKPQIEIEVVPIQTTGTTRKPPSIYALLGRMIDATGKPVDGKGPITEKSAQQVVISSHLNASPVLETGIKAVDLFAPLKRGGDAGMQMCFEVGRMLLKGQIIRNLVIERGHKVVYLSLSPGPPQFQYREYFDFGTGEAFNKGVTFVLGETTDSSARRQAIVEKGLKIACDFRDAGNDVLLALEGHLQTEEGVVDYLRTYATSTADGAITTLYTGDPPDGLEADSFADLDALIALSPVRANSGLYPAIDPMLSRSALFNSRVFARDHENIVAAARRYFFRYYNCNLYAANKKRGKDCVYLDDGGESARVVTRTRRLDLFLTQSVHGTEMWTGKPGTTIPLAHTVETCRRILVGEYDDVAEEAWYMMGRMEDILEKAKGMGNG